MKKEMIFDDDDDDPADKVLDGLRACAPGKELSVLQNILCPKSECNLKEIEIVKNSLHHYLSLYYPSIHIELFGSNATGTALKGKSVIIFMGAEHELIHFFSIADSDIDFNIELATKEIYKLKEYWKNRNNLLILNELYAVH